MQDCTITNIQYNWFQIVGSLVDFRGQMSFINNSATGEGALSLLSFGQIRMNKGLSINFEGNSGRYVHEVGIQ